MCVWLCVCVCLLACVRASAHARVYVCLCVCHQRRQREAMHAVEQEGDDAYEAQLPRLLHEFEEPEAHLRSRAIE